MLYLPRWTHIGAWKRGVPNTGRHGRAGDFTAGVVAFAGELAVGRGRGGVALPP